MAVTGLALCILLLLRWGQASPIPSLEEPWSFSGTFGAADPSLVDQDDNVDVQALLGQFLYMLNLTEQGAAPRPKPAHVEPPEYMLELYNHYANDHSTVPAANIARSFKNEDSSPNSVTSRGVRTHPLMFNVSIPHQERIITAELRLYMLVHREPRHFDGVDWKVTVFEMQGEGGSPPYHKSEVGDSLIGMQELVAKHGHRKESGWEVLLLTDAVHRWTKSESTNHRLELHVESFYNDGTESEDDGDGTTFIGLDIDRSPEGKHVPVLIVFSDKESGNPQDGPQKIRDRITGGSNPNRMGADEKDEDVQQQDEALLMQIRSNVIYDNAPRTRRNAKGSHCKRTSLFVEFKDIGWDSWILAPPGFEAYSCQGGCSYPMSPQVSPTKHAIIQTLVNLKSPQKVSQACCVPTKLEPISLLYINENSHVIFQHKYEGMVVAECGCR